jgi:hypothetical protein
VEVLVVEAAQPVQEHERYRIGDVVRLVARERHDEPEQLELALAQGVPLDRTAVPGDFELEVGGQPSALEAGVEAFYYLFLRPLSGSFYFLSLLLLSFPHILVLI